jgi:hypothetical protein
VEEQHPKYQDDEHEAKAVEQVQEVESSGAEEGVAESFDDRRQGVRQDQGLEGFRHRRHGVNHWRQVHPELHTKCHQVAQVAVAGGQRGDQNAEAQPEAGHHQEQNWCQQQGCIRLHRVAQQGIDDYEADEQPELDAEGDQVGDQDRDRHRQAREVDLAEETGVADEGLGGLRQAGGEVCPDDGPGHVEEERRDAVGGQSGDPAEDHGEDNGGQQRLQQVPERAEDGLLVLRDEVAPDEQAHQVAVCPELAQVQVVPGALRLDDEGPVVFSFGLRCGCLHLRGTSGARFRSRRGIPAAPVPGISWRLVHAPASGRRE